MSYQIGLKPPSTAPLFPVLSAILQRRNSEISENLFSTPKNFIGGTINAIDATGNITDISGIYCFTVGALGTNCFYDVYVRNNAEEEWVYVQQAIATPAGSDGGFNISIVNDLSDFLPVLTTAEVITLTQAQQTVFDALSSEQQAVVASLTAEQQVTMLSGTAAQKNALIATLSPIKQSVFTSTPVQFIETVGQVASDKLTIEQIVNKLKNGQFITDDESVFYALGNSLMATAAMAEIDAGRGFDGLRNIGLTQPQALKVLSIYNVTIETSKYESEIALSALALDPTKIVALKDYLASLNPPLQLPPVNSYLGELRANHAVYTAIAGWNG